MEIIIAGYLPFAGCKKWLSLIRLQKQMAQKQKSPLSASGLCFFAVWAYNVAPRRNLYGLLNRYPNQRNEKFVAQFPVVLVVEMLVIKIPVGYRALVYFFRLAMTTAFFRAVRLQCPHLAAPIYFTQYSRTAIL
jgi:hypothetical protein